MLMFNFTILKSVSKLVNDLYSAKLSKGIRAHWQGAKGSVSDCGRLNGREFQSLGAGIRKAREPKDKLSR